MTSLPWLPTCATLYKVETMGKSTKAIPFIFLNKIEEIEIDNGISRTHELIYNLSSPPFLFSFTFHNSTACLLHSIAMEFKWNAGICLVSPSLSFH